MYLIEENLKVGSTSGEKEERMIESEQCSWILEFSPERGYWLTVCALQNLEGTKNGKSRGCKSRKKTERPPTFLQWESDRPIDSASSRKFPIILKALVSTVSS